jgi:hypothetical protein
MDTLHPSENILNSLKNFLLKCYILKVGYINQKKCTTLKN